MSAGVPHAISWNLTGRCNLRCSHCYLSARALAGASDPSTRECLRVVDELADLNPNLFLILTGGEPLLRPDLTAVSRAAAAAGMTVVVGTNGTLLSARAASALRASGVQGVGISLDAARRPDLHDQLRGRPGAWKGALAGLHAAREAGLELAVQTSVFRWNRHEIAAIGELAAEFAAKAWNLYFLVCTGRGQALTDLTPEEYEAQLHELKRIQHTMSDRLFVAVRCAPQYGRVLAQEHSPTALVRAYPSGCPAAMHYARIGPAGEVTPCPYMPQVAGRLTEQSFREIWERSPLLLRLRDRSGLGGKCAMCSYRDRCGGCRARASASLGDAMAEDPSCLYQPDSRGGKAVAGQPAFALPPECTMPWTAQARQRLERTPSFVRGLVVRRVEEEARRRGSGEVSADVMQAVRQRTMGTGAIVTVPRGTAGHQPATSWSPAAHARVEHAPNFVRPGIHKLMELRARERGVSEITSEFVSEIRDESMMRVAQIIRRFGLEEVRPAAFAEARRRMARKERKLLVLNQIEALLRGRSAPNREILDKFRRFMEAAPLRGRPWLPDAEARLDHLPAGRRAEARIRVENEAHRRKAPVVTRSLVEVVLARGGAGSSTPGCKIGHSAASCLSAARRSE